MGNDKGLETGVYKKKKKKKKRKNKPVAIIDIGSNSVRLVIFDSARRSPDTLFNEKISCGLGREIASTGRLPDKAVERALEALTRFRAIADRIGAKKIHVIATAAAREAENGPDFLTWAQGICGSKIQLLSGRGEAEMAANGVMAGMHHADGLAGDMGGGSLELIDIDEGVLVGGDTLPLGSLRMMDITKGDMQKAKEFIDEHLATIDWLSRGKGRPFYAVGGTWRAMARLYMKQYDYPLHVMHNFSIDADEAHRFADFVSYKILKSPETLLGFDELSKVRQSTLPYGALLMERVIRKIEPSKIITSSFGVREGLLFSLLRPGERKRDPLIAACEDLAEMRARCPKHGRELCEWTDKLFMQEESLETEEEKRLRYAACLLSDIGWRSHPDYRSMQTLDFVAYASFSGIDHAGRVFLALTQFFRHAGVKEEPDAAIIDLLDERALQRARIIGAAIRVATMVSAALPGLMENTPILLDEDRLYLTLSSENAVLEGERLQKRLGVLAKLLGCKPVVRVEHELV
ncbi:MAG: Ppx/GppA family phosphatase [Hyphomicrobiaceae bacterium]|nr:Ppx/GppA family phosphatase [Hyphomicrobiaceae bacterium]